MSKFVFTSKMDEWLMENYLKDVVTRTTKIFNHVFDTKVTSDTLKSHARCKLGLFKGAKVTQFTQEEDAWLREHYYLGTVKDTLAAFETKFGHEVNLSTLKWRCNNVLDLRKEKRGDFTKEENEWFKKFYPKYGSRETTKEFEKVFGRKLTQHQVVCHCNKIGVFTDGRYYTKKEEEWLKNNWNTFETPKSAHEAFVAKFGGKHGAHNLRTKVCEMGIKLDKLWYSQEEIEWIKENYPRSDLSVKEIYKLFCDKFGKDASTYKAFITFAKKHGFINDERKGILKLGTRKWYDKKRKELGISDDEVLSDLGNGEIIAIDKKFYKNMAGRGVLGKGEITETYLDICKAKDLINALRNQLSKVND